MPLLIVESATKARKIQGYLGPGWKVEACFGHIRDLPSNKKEIPSDHQDKAWAELGIDVDNGYQALYVNRDEKQVIGKLKKAAKEVGGDVYLASDPDREGESIAWHLAVLLGLNPQTAKRVTYQEVTKEAVKKAVANPRRINMQLVAAQEGRRFLDRLSGYGTSPLLWRAIGGPQSAGRVQSATLMLLAQREQARLSFTSASFWKITAQVESEPGFTANLSKIGGIPLATASSFTPEGQLKSDIEVVQLDQQEAKKLQQRLEQATLSVTAAEKTPVSRRPPAPFTTSSLQQAASSKLKFSVEQTTQLAQNLYEAGKITYIRTDSPTLSDEALDLAREAVRGRFGEQAVPDKPRQYATRNANAQEAHEAIRPAGYFLAPEDAGLEGDELKLYELIYNRTIASQMHDAQGEKTSLTLQTGELELAAAGTVLTSPGFTLVYQDDDKAEEKLPLLSVGAQVQTTAASAEAKESSAPGRYGEGKFVELMEKSGIGRPSTYASTLATLLRRKYITIVSRQIHVTPLGFINAMYLFKQVPLMVDNRFTAQMEKDLDRVAEGELTRNEYLDTTWKNTLLPLIQKAQTTPPRTRVPQLDGAILEVGQGEVYLNYEGRKAMLPEGLLLEDITQESVESILSGTWKKKKGRTPATKEKAGAKAKPSRKK